MQRVDRTVARWAVGVGEQLEAAETDELSTMLIELEMLQKTLRACQSAGFTKWSQVVAAAERKGNKQ